MREERGVEGEGIIVRCNNWAELEVKMGVYRGLINGYYEH